MTQRLIGRPVIWSTLLALVGIFLGFPGPSSGEQVNLHVSGWGTSPNSLVFKIGHDQGFYKREGLEVIPTTATMQAGIQGLVAGSFDFSQILGTLVAAAILRGVPLKIVMVFDTRPLYWLYGKKEIQSVRDLRGKVIGVSSLGAGPDQITREILPGHGLDPRRDVFIRSAGNEPERLAALMTGVVDAAVLSPPGNFVAKKNGFRELLFYGDEVEYVTGGVVVTDKTLSNKPDFVRRFLQGTLNAFLWYKSEEKEAVNYVREAVKISADEAAELHKAAVRGFSPNGIISPALQEQVFALQRKMLKAEERVPITKVYDFSILHSLNQ